MARQPLSKGEEKPHVVDIVVTGKKSKIKGPFLEKNKIKSGVNGLFFFSRNKRGRLISFNSKTSVCP